MTSKELNEILNKTRRTLDISLTPKQVEELVKDLEILEELKKIMGTPIQDIMKQLKVLEEIRNCIKVIDYGEEYRNRYVLQVGNDIYHLMMKEDYNRWNRWLNE